MAKIKTDIYNKIIQGVDLRKLYLKEFSGELKPDIMGGVASVNIKINKASYTTKPENIVEIVQKWTVLAKDRKSQTEFLNISVTYCLILHSKEKFTKEFFEVYQNTSLLLNIGPFVREFINSMTARMNLPPLTLPFFKTLPMK